MFISGELTHGHDMIDLDVLSRGKLAAIGAEISPFLPPWPGMTYSSCL